MSARHLQALRGPSLEPPAHTPSDEEEEEEEEEEARGQTGGGFGLLLASSDEEDEDEDDEDWAQDQGEEEEQQEPAPAPAPAKQVTPQPKKAPPPPPPAKQVDEEDDDVWLEIQRQQEGGGLDTTATPAVGTSSKKRAAKPPVVPLALAFDTRCLNLEHELKFRFGAEGVMPGGAEGGGGGGNRRRGGAIGGARGGAGGGVLTQLYNRRCFFGPPKEDWPRPPTYVGGGLRMVRVEAPADCRDPEEAARDWYAFEWSPSFQALQQDYERVVATCDPNALAIWLAHNPHYVDGLLTLALVLAAHGQMDRAHDHIRRCLFTFEAAGYLESFRSSFLGSTTGGGPRAVDCRMDVRRPENRPFFMAMFRHVQMLGGRGLYQTAFEVAKFLLALDPLGDPTGILLCLDFYAISAGKKEQLLAMMEAGFPIGTGWTEGEEEEDEEEEASDDEDDLGTRRRTASPPSLTVRALPNMCYSCALAMFLGSRNNATLRIQARDALRDALLRFPVVLTPLVEKCRNELGSRITQPWYVLSILHPQTNRHASHAHTHTTKQGPGPAAPLLRQRRVSLAARLRAAAPGRRLHAAKLRPVGRRPRGHAVPL